MQQLPKQIPLTEWVRRLNDEEMPIFAQTARRIAGVSADDEASVGDLARIILQDSSMTARVLRIANSVHYNPSAHPISTVSRAIVMLGFDVVRSIALSIAMVDTLLRGVQHERVVSEMARSFHAAVQAKSFALARQDPSAEEVFIATLLCRIGNMAFWCFPHGFAAALDEQLRSSGEEEAAVEQRVLGFGLRELTASLNREWHLSALLGQALEGPKGAHPRAGNLELGYALAEAVEQGWDTPDVAQLVDRIAEAVYLPRDKAADMVHENARVAIETAAEFGAHTASRLIPLPKGPQRRAAAEDAGPDEAHSAPDSALQLHILRELSSMLQERVGVNAVLGTVLEGVYRALAMDRVIFAVVAPGRDGLQAKYVLGDYEDRLARCLSLSAKEQAGNVFAEALSNRWPLWVSQDDRNIALSATIRSCLGTADFFVAPLVSGERRIGVIYADRASSGRALDEESFSGFRHFCEQANLGFAILGQR
jgi:HD-like signal output (HDOD) protein